MLEAPGRRSPGRWASLGPSGQNVRIPNTRTLRMGFVVSYAYCFGKLCSISTNLRFLIRDDEKTSVRGPEARQDAENAEEFKFHFPRKEIDNFRIAVLTGSVRVRNYEFTVLYGIYGPYSTSHVQI